MTDENKNIENNREENQNKTKCNKKWWKKLLGLNQTYGLWTLKQFLFDKVYIFSFIATVVYAFLFYIVSTHEILNEIYKHKFILADTLRKLNETGLLEIIPFVVIWITYFITVKPDFRYLNKKRNKFCFGYGLFLFPFTWIAFWLRGRDALTIQAIWSNSIIFSVYRIIGSILLLILVNVIIELIVKIHKK